MEEFLWNVQDLVTKADLKYIFLSFFLRDKIFKKYNFHIFILVWLLLRDHHFTRICIITTVGVKCCVTAVKSHNDFISVLLYFFWSFRINDSNTFSIENWIPLKPGLGTCLWEMLNFSLSVMNTLNFFILVWLLSRDQCFNDKYLTSGAVCNLQMKKYEDCFKWCDDALAVSFYYLASSFVW